MASVYPEDLIRKTGEGPYWENPPAEKDTTAERGWLGRTVRNASDVIDSLYAGLGVSPEKSVSNYLPEVRSQSPSPEGAFSLPFMPGAMTRKQLRESLLDSVTVTRPQFPIYEFVGPRGSTIRKPILAGFQGPGTVSEIPPAFSDPEWIRRMEHVAKTVPEPALESLNAVTRESPYAVTHGHQPWKNLTMEGAEYSREGKAIFLPKQGLYIPGEESTSTALGTAHEMAHHIMDRGHRMAGTEAKDMLDKMNVKYRGFSPPMPEYRTDPEEMIAQTYGKYLAKPTSTFYEKYLMNPSEGHFAKTYKGNKAREIIELLQKLGELK